MVKKMTHQKNKGSIKRKKKGSGEGERNEGRKGERGKRTLRAG